MQHAAPPSRRPFVLAGIVALALAVGLGALVAVRESVGFDESWMAAVLTWRDPFGEAVSRVFDFLGGGWFAIFAVPLGVALAFVLAKRPWHALAFVLASAVSAGVCQLLKAAFARARPHDILLPLDNGSFPSGHTTNAAVIAVLLALLAGRAWVWVLGMLYLVAMAFTRTYLGAHWVTDTLGGALLGAGVALLVWCLLLPKLRPQASRADLRAGRARGRTPRPTAGR